MGIHWQLSRYALVGIGSNIILYIGYLFLTNLGMGHKTAMTFLYIVGVLQTFLFNRAWTFRYQGRVSGSMLRYGVTYLFGYLFNLVALLILVDRFSLPHQAVQGVLILVVAGLLFLLQKFWVFSDRGHLTVMDPGK